MKKELEDRVKANKAEIETNAPKVWERIVDRLIAKGKIAKNKKQIVIDKVNKPKKPK